MSIFNDKALKGVAEAAAKIMAETSHGSTPKTDKEKSLAALAHPKDKITHKDVLVGRGVIKKEEVEQLDEVGDTPAGRKALGSYVSKAIADKSKDRTKGLRKATSRMYKDDYYGKKTNEEVELHEETEQLQEYESKGGVFRHSAKLEKGSQYGSSDYSKGGEEEKEAKKLTSSPKRAQKGYGPRQNTGMRGLSIPGLVKADGSKVKKEELSFTDMLELYNEHGLKVLAPIETEEMDIDGTKIEVLDADKVNGVVETIVEEPTNDEWTKEYEDQKASFEAKKKQPKIAAGKTVGVKTMPESVEQIDELSKTTLGSYIKKANARQQDDYREAGYKSEEPDRRQGLGRTEKIHRAVDKLTSKKTNEEVEQIDERELTKGEAKKKEDYVMGMKKKLSGFKQRYGERAKSVLYATATSMAKKKS